MNTPISKVTNCILLQREEETLFHVDGDTGIITPTLDGYAIIPVEVYEKLTNQPTGTRKT